MVTFGNFEICIESGTITDHGPNKAGIPKRVEPRIMKVLEVLISESPNVVTREYLIDKIWNNYGGGDDGLTQAISHLRKLFNDTDKDNRIIETVIKKGYRFNKSVIEIGSTSLDRKRQKRKSRIWIGSLSLLLFIVIVWFAISKLFVEEIPMPEATRSEKNTEKFKETPLAP